MNEKYYVIAGNYAEYQVFSRKKCGEFGGSLSLSNFVYVQNKESTIGVRNPTGWLVGTWRERPDIRDVIYHLLLRSGLDGSGTNKTLRKILDELNEQHTLNHKI